MKNKEFEALASRLLPDFPDFSVQGHLVVRLPVGDVLRALVFESSSFNKRIFYITFFFLPLYVPTKHLYLSFGDRLREGGGADGWSADAPDLVANLRRDIRRQALPFIAGIESAADVAERATVDFEKWRSPYAQQAVAYSWARAGHLARAAEAIERLLGLLSVDVPWQREMAQRSEVLRSKLSAPSELQSQLDHWKAESVTNLRLAKFLS